VAPRQSTLGMIWDTQADDLFVKRPPLEFEREGDFTKRQAVSLSHQLFDPLSLWSPFYVKLNLCCSNIVRSVTEWDAQVPASLIKEWNTAVRDLNDIESMPIPRRRVPNNLSENSLFEYHVFADSSKDTAAAAVYLRTVTGDDYEVNLIAAKTSIFSQAEMKRQSIPRKELIALDLGARLLRECLDSTTLDIQGYELWSDSKTVIQWCAQRSLELRVFERNRVDLIMKNTNGQVPKYVPTNINPADVVMDKYPNMCLPISILLMWPLVVAEPLTKRNGNYGRGDQNFCTTQKKLGERTWKVNVMTTR